MPLFSTTEEEKMNFQLARVFPLPPLRISLLLPVLIGVFAALVGVPQSARAGVAGQQEVWEDLEFGVASGQVFNPHQIGVDPVDGSVYVLSSAPEFTEDKLDKFSATGQPEGTVSLSRTPEEAGAEGARTFVGIAVRHKEGEATGKVYLIQGEAGLNTTEPEAKVATKVLVFSTGPAGGAPVQEPSLTLPGANTAEAIFYPNEVHVDPANGDLVLSASALDGTAQLVRITEAGAVEPGRYVESGNSLGTQPASSTGELNFGFDVGNDGTTYIVTNSGTSAAPSIEAFTLPPEFHPPSGPLALTALPGFTAAGTSEGWKGQQNGFLVVPPNPAGDGKGPQVAVATAPDGEETLFWRTGRGEEEHESITIHGFSLQQQATNALYGGGSAVQECSIESRISSFAATKEGNLEVLEQGEPVSEASPPPTLKPNVLRFGPGGSECPGPAASIGLPASAAAGSSVTLDASGTEHAGSTIAGLTWTIEKEGGGTETIPVSGPAPSLTTPHVFATEGTYTVRLAITTTASVGNAGHGFVAKPKAITITAAPPGPTVTGISPTHGPAAGGTVVTITGTNLTGATAVKFGTVAGTGLTQVSATEVKAASPACTAGEVVDVTVTTPDGTSPTGAADKFTCDTPAGTPTVTGISPTHGPAAGGTVVTITGTNLAGATEIKFGTVAGTGLTQVSATEVKATSPAGTAGDIVHVVVTTGGGTSVTGAADEFTYDLPTRSLTINKVGSGTGTVTCDGGACQNSYTAGSSVVLAATAGSGSTFVGWSGGGCGGTAPCTVVLTANTVVTATFNTATTTPPGNNPPNTTPPGTTPPNTTPPPPGKTAKQILEEKRKKALQKCKKLKGKAKAQCVKKANQIGKPKKKSGKK
jgi:IPT/TIG domain-containing protein/List-Bact-rpt repeat protein